jgi:hypothetical protein
MCAIAVIPLAITAISTAVAAYSAYQQAQSQNKANEYNAAVQNRNAQNANIQADAVVQQGAIDEANQRKKVQQFIGSQRAAASANGVLVDDGSALDTTSDTAGYGELDALTIRNNAARAEWGVRNQAADYQAGAQLSLMKNTSPTMAAGTTLLAGASQMAGSYGSFKKQGMLG